MMEELDDQKSTQGVDEYWAMVVRRRWWILGPLFFGWLLVLASAWVIPAKYASESVVLVEPPKVPKDLVAPNVQVDLADRVQSMGTQILSRTRLLNLIERFHLYPGYVSSPDDQVEKMRDDVKFELVEAPTSNGNQELIAFKMAYKSPDPSIAQKVNAALTSFFVDENVRASQEQSEATTLFLDTQVRALGRTLADEEAKLRAYEAKHDGSLPQQLQSNMQILTGIQNQLQAAHTSHERALQQQTYLSSLQKQYETMGDSVDAPKSVDSQLESARAQLADLQARYTDDHPDIKKLKEIIAGLEKLKKDMSAEAKEKLDTNTASAEQVQAMTPRVQLQSQIKINKMELQASEEQIQRLEQAAQMYQARLNATPAVEAEMSDMMRDFGDMKKGYADLLAKKGESSLATSLEKQQQGAQFRVIDPPSLPDKPAFPDRFKFSLAAVGAGLALAVLFGVGSEFLDDRIRNEQALNEAVSLPVLVEIPPLPTPAEIRAARWRPWLAVAATVAVAILLPAAVAYTYFWGS
jgi:polysaccharide chain length determinant protein (PEP-CTERM system associated)